MFLSLSSNEVMEVVDYDFSVRRKFLERYVLQWSIQDVVFFYGQ